jgi:hypothetical protein
LVAGLSEAARAAALTAAAIVRRIAVITVMPRIAAVITFMIVVSFRVLISGRCCGRHNSHLGSPPGGWSHQTDIGASHPTGSASIHGGSCVLSAVMCVRGRVTTGYRVRTALPAPQAELLAAPTSFSCSMLKLSIPIPLARPLRLDRRE